MKTYIIINKITKDVEGIPSTTEHGSIVISENQELFEIDEEIKKIIRNARSGSYFENGVVVPKQAQNTPYDSWDYLTKSWVTDTQAQLAGEAIEVRDIRATLLTEMDVVVSNPLRWAEMSTEKQAQWVQYRQDLLDIPQQSGFPLNVIYPTPPN